MSTSIASLPTVNQPRTRPQLPRRSSSLHKQVIAKLRPLPFQYIWSAWHSKPVDSQYALTVLASEVPDIATFYRIYNHVPWELIRQKDAMHFFRSGVKPLWEDEQNVDGGCWVMKVRKEHERAIRVWEEICLMCCGGQLQAAVTAERDHILGISYSPRVYSAHISIWTKQGANQASVLCLEQAVLNGLSSEYRPKSASEYYYKKHSDHEGWADVMKQ